MAGFWHTIACILKCGVSGIRCSKCLACLLSFLGELPPTRGERVAPHEIGYMGQQPWLRSSKWKSTPSHDEKKTTALHPPPAPLECRRRAIGGR